MDRTNKLKKPIQYRKSNIKIIKWSEDSHNIEKLVKTKEGWTKTNNFNTQDFYILYFLLQDFFSLDKRTIEKK